MFTRHRVQKLVAAGHLIIAPSLLYSTLCHSTLTPSPSMAPIPYISDTNCDMLPEGLVRQTCIMYFQNARVLYFGAPTNLNQITHEATTSDWLVLLDGRNGAINADGAVLVGESSNNMHIRGVANHVINRPELRLVNGPGDIDSLLDVSAPVFRISNLKIVDTGANNARSLLEFTNYRNITIKNNTLLLSGRLPHTIFLHNPECDASNASIDFSQPANIIAGNTITTAFGFAKASVTTPGIHSYGTFGVHIESNCSFDATNLVASQSNTYNIARASTGIGFQSGALLVRGDRFTQVSANQGNEISYGVFFYERGEEHSTVSPTTSEPNNDNKYTSEIIDSTFTASGYANMYGINLKHHSHDPDHSVKIARNRFVGVKKAIAFSNGTPSSPTPTAMDNIAGGSVCNIWEPNDNSDSHPCFVQSDDSPNGSNSPASGFVHFIGPDGNNLFCGRPPEGFSVDCTPETSSSAIAPSFTKPSSVAMSTGSIASSSKATLASISKVLLAASTSLTPYETATSNIGEQASTDKRSSSNSNTGYYAAGGAGVFVVTAVAVITAVVVYRVYRKAVVPNGAYTLPNPSANSISI